MKNTIVIFGKHILLAEALVSRLRQYLSGAQVEVVSPDHPNAIEQIVNINPAAVILDTTDGDIFQHNPIQILLQVLPNLNIICVSLQQEDVQVVSSQMHHAMTVQDLLAFLPQASGAMVEEVTPSIGRFYSGESRL